MSELPELTVIDGKPAVTSLQVAEDFSLLHKNVIQSVESLQVSEKFRKLNFQLSDYTVEGQTRKYKQYLLTRDGFTMLVMGFNGKKAAEFKEAYIEAFNKMESELADPKRQTYERISSQQYSEMVGAIHDCFSGYLFNSEGHVLQNRIRAAFNIHRLEDLPAEYFDLTMSMIREAGQNVREFYSWFAAVKKHFLRDYVGGRAPWTPHLKKKWAQQMEEKLPERPDWLEIRDQLNQVKTH